VTAVPVTRPVVRLDSVEVDPLGATGRKKVPADDPYLAGHYPQLALWPGVFLIDSAAQVAARHFAAHQPRLAEAVLAEVASVRFLRPVLPGDEYEVRVEPAGPAGVVRVRCLVGRELAARMTLRLAVPEPAVPEPAAPEPILLSCPVDADPRRLLPHRPPMLLVDLVLAAGALSVVTQKVVRPDEPCFAGAPAGALAWPSPFVLESFAQSCGVLWALAAERACRPVPGLLVFGAARGVTFPRPVPVGAVLTHTVRLEQAIGDDAAMFSGSARVDGQPVLSVEGATALLRPAEALAGTP